MNYKYNLTDNCPNLELDEAGFDNYYRLIKEDTPKSDDFVPHYFLLKFRNKNWKSSLCSSQGISLFGELNDIKMLINSFPNLKKQFKTVYRGIVSENNGLR